MFYQASATDPECSSESGLQRAEESSCHSSLHQLALAANSCSHQIQDTGVCLQDNHWRCTNIPNSLVQTYVRSRSLRSASERCLVVPSQKGTESLSWTVPSWRNNLPISIRAAESSAIFKKHLKTHLFCHHLTN